MKLVMAVVHNDDVTKLSDELSKRKVGATKVASTGGFLKSGNTTFMIGVEEDRVDEVLEVIKNTCKSRKQTIQPYPGSSKSPYSLEVIIGGATVFILDVEQFIKI